MEIFDQEILTASSVFGDPKKFTKQLEANYHFPPVYDRDGRVGEIAMVIVNNEGKLWLMSKKYYPEGLLRIPTGGIKRNESLVDALRRELKEETSFDLKDAEFIGAINYSIKNFDGEVMFASYIFKVLVGDFIPKCLDLSEKIDEFKLVSLDQVKQIADFWENQDEIKGRPYFPDSGRFRAILHHVVSTLLKEE